MLATSTEQTVDVWLEEHDHLPPETRPTFVYRFVSMSSYFRRQRLRKEVPEQKTYPDGNAKMNESLSVGLVGWRNVTDDDGVGVPYAAGSTDGFDALGWGQKMSLYSRIVETADFGDPDRKKSPSSLGSAPAPSAATASPPATA